MKFIEKAEGLTMQFESTDSYLERKIAKDFFDLTLHIMQYKKEVL